MTPKLDWQWPAAVVFSVTFATLGALVYTKTLHPEVLIAMLTWLVPSPYQGKPKDPQT